MKSAKNSRGFTLIEVMIAIAIFGFLMLYVSQLMRGEIRMLNASTRQNNIEQSARVTMMHILDEIRLHQATYYVDGTTGVDQGIYYRNPDAAQMGEDEVECLLDLEPKAVDNLPAGTGIYFDSVKHEVWYRDIQNQNANYRIAEFIDTVTITPADQYGHLIKINLIAKDPTSTAKFDLVTWVRLY